MKKFKGSFLSHIIVFVSLTVFFASCTPVDVFEKNVSIPGYAWSSDFKPEITFDVTDTTTQYMIYIVIRHLDAYRYKNIYMNVHVRAPNGVERSKAVELQLATDDRGWLGSGMDDIFEHRIPFPPAGPEKLQAGTYTFRLENIMRDNPLQHVMNVGIRLEKVK